MFWKPAANPAPTYTSPTTSPDTNGTHTQRPRHVYHQIPSLPRHSSNLVPPLQRHVGACFCYKASGCLWWLGKFPAHPLSPSKYVVRFVDDPVPVTLVLSSTRDSIAIEADGGLWYLQVHQGRPLMRSMVGNADEFRGAQIVG